jgi:hypothetical protein
MSNDDEDANPDDFILVGIFDKETDIDLHRHLYIFLPLSSPFFYVFLLHSYYYYETTVLL